MKCPEPSTPKKPVATLVSGLKDRLPVVIPSCAGYRKTTDNVTCANDTKVGLFICNYNAVQDDSWDIYIDGVYVANFNIGNEYRALIILPMSWAAIPSFANVTGRGCTLFSYVFTTVLDALVTGPHKMEMVLMVKNGAGNAGSVEFICGKETTSGSVVTFEAGNAGHYTYTNPTPYTIGEKLAYRFRYTATP